METTSTAYSSSGSSSLFREYQRRWLADETTTAEEAQEIIATVSGSTSSSNVAAAVLSNLFLFFLLFGLSATVDLKNLKKQARNWRALSLGIAVQFAVMPLLGFVSVVLFTKLGGGGGSGGEGPFTTAMATTLLVVTSSPGGAFSNWWCSTFNAELALSVAMTTISTVVSIGFLPLNLLLYTYLAFGTGLLKQEEDGDSEDASGKNSVVSAIDFGALFLTLAIVVSAVVSGLLAGYKWDTPRFHVWCNRFGTVSGAVLIILTFVLGSGGGGSESTWFQQDWSFYVATAFPCLMGVAIANVASILAKRSGPETVAIAIECCYQNIGIAMSVAITIFADDVELRAQAVAVPLFYGIVQAVTIGCYSLWAWKFGWTKAPADERIWIVITKTYEVIDHEHGHHDDDDTTAAGEGSFENRVDLSDKSKTLHSRARSVTGDAEDSDSDRDDDSFFEMAEAEAGNAANSARASSKSRHRRALADFMSHSRPISQSRRQRLAGSGNGIWAHVFPPVLIRMASSFMDGDVEARNDAGDGDEDAEVSAREERADDKGEANSPEVESASPESVADESASTEPVENECASPEPVADVESS